MPLFRLSKRIEFPPAWLARPDGLLCIGGDLSPRRILLAYQKGIFPWFSDQEPILWWSPDPRLVLYPDQVKVARSLRKKIRKQPFDIRVDTAFGRTISACAQPRGVHRHEGTWLIPEMIEAYTALHRMGIAHSIEAWQGERLVGGLYGVSMGTAFFGESMFSWEPDASKIALVTLAAHLSAHHFDFIDCQVTTDHLLSMGAMEISRDLFLSLLDAAVSRRISNHVWNKGPLPMPAPLMSPVCSVG